MEKSTGEETLEIMLNSAELVNEESMNEEFTEPKQTKSKTKKAQKTSASKGKSRSAKVSKPDSTIRQTRSTTRANKEKEMAEKEMASATTPTTSTKRKSKGTTSRKPKDLNPEWQKWVFHDFDDSGCDGENAQRMFHHLLKVRPKNCCNKVIASGIRSIQCQCLKRIATLLSTATPGQQEEWMAIFRKFSRVLRPIAIANDSVSTLVQFLYEFSHTSTLGGNKCTRSYVVKTPNGPLLMDFNGIAELGGYEQRTRYAKFYTKCLTGSQHEDHVVASSYVQDVYKKQGKLDAFVDIVQYCSEKKKHPRTKYQNFEINLTRNICDWRRSNGYYLTDPDNYDYSIIQNLGQHQ
jgi:hypothetical protein